jgi:metal-sulfur cluster biosynthetic enzyme
MLQLDNAAVMAALATVQDPDLHRDLVTLGMIEALAVEGGRVSFTLVLTTSACPLKDKIESDCRAAVGAVPGVREVAITTTSRVRKSVSPTADRKALEQLVDLHNRAVPSVMDGDLHCSQKVDLDREPALVCRILIDECDIEWHGLEFRRSRERREDSHKGQQNRNECRDLQGRKPFHDCSPCLTIFSAVE